MQKAIPLSELKHSPNNVRKVKPSDQGFKSLCASINHVGLLHNLVVTKNGSGYVVVDGNRRLDALNAIYAEDNPKINCVVIENDDTEIGLHANMMREGMHPLDECDVIMALCADGSEDFDSVGKRFGHTTQWVKQRVALAELSDLAKTMFRNGEFNMSTAQALTLGSMERQDEYLKDNDNPHAASAKRYMTSQKVPVTAALFDIEPIKHDLNITSDLFGEEQFINNREAFEYHQNKHVVAMCDEFRQEGYYDVVHLVDTYWFDSPELRMFRQVWDTDSYSSSDLIVVVSYNSFNYTVDIKKMARVETKEEIEAKEAEEENGEITPLDYSNPQRDLVHSYFADAMVRNMWTEHFLWENPDSIDYPKFFKAMLCHRKLGWGGHHVHRVGAIYSDPQNLFPAGGEPDGYDDLPFIKTIEKHRDAANSAYEADGTTPLMYCYNLDDSELDNLFVASCLQGLNKSDFQSEAMEDFIKLCKPRNWFTPDASWVNKWKINQIEDVERWLYAGTKGGSKSDRVNNIVESMSDGRFDPYGEWPPRSEQS